jgi:glycosyltransferase involved in cell wall biosynthesis
MAKVSVVIPCYNQGRFLEDAVDSALAQTCQDIEIIIVNDGSEDEETIELCNAYNQKGITVVTTDNQGLAAARNNGIEKASGIYILPLDADDIIDPNYIAEAITVLDENPQVGIVYCQARLFGAVDTAWQLPEYSLAEMLKDNIIFCSALFRRSDWQLVGGYDTGMIYGWEDYEFWLSLIEQGKEVRRLDGRYFRYRVAADSMVRSKDKYQKIEMFKRIYERHNKLIGDHIEVWIEPLLELKEPYLTSRLYVDCGTGISDADSIARKIEPGRRLIRFPIDSFEGRCSLRYDPVDCPACIEIESIDLVFHDRRLSLDVKEITSNASYQINNLFLFDTADPQIFLPIKEDQVAQIIEVAITCDIQKNNHEALQEIIAFQKEVIDKKKKLIPLPKWLQSTS